ncbi:2-oxoglutarate-Fe(II) type oxidoreductase ppzD-like [Branchiostoma floridae]|uniref:2-oxoglutarate-Fe(II) type oxidoreductase ppzD-like n=1 Tax=Branchiostoma floridae TaxID=7739 RepID=A0A9J7L622_BRAFL|nr:2-oxoglutarate-Fe(II) type oxidoreductase ppzD-like [Branchiostoma floridae]
MIRLCQILDVNGFLDKFKYVGKGRNGTNLRTLRYPPVKEEVKKDQVRCGEHTDFGCLTLVFQDNIGLEVMNVDGEYVPASPIPDTIVVNIADTLQRWSADKLKSTRHRVVLPDSREERQRVHRSIAYFFHCDSDVEMKCLDGSDKYEPISAREYLLQQIGTTYLTG